MSEPKAFASLSSGLLARKGAARPAMRPQGFGQMGAGLDDLGWNDMGFDPPKPHEGEPVDEGHDAFGEEIESAPKRNPLSGLTPASPVHDQHAEIEERFGIAEGDEHDDSADIYDDTAELYDDSDEVKIDLGMGRHDSEAGDDVPLKRTVADIAPKKMMALPEPTAEDEEEVQLPEPTLVEPSEPVATVTPIAAAAPKPAAPASRRAATPRSAPGAKGKAAFTLRLDKQRHLKLRLACAVSGQSAQKFVTEALDALLESMPELDQLAEKAPEAKKRA
ncbi:hypothetical protein [Sphingomicrobium nitratireducens]|uniref:hypothetical protein n=1 Tax=Sphingomicrobium nitratireducens TaxID=2964666 RepID=UPI00223E9D2D|nr:hypothetical protein [Sphingomicrobium nitratireducens]